MGTINIKLNVEDEKANTNITTNQISVRELSVAVVQLELLKLKLLGKIAGQSITKINKN